MPMNDRQLYRDHLLSLSAVPLDDGRFQARVAIAAISGERTRAQRFLDLDGFATVQEALDHARQAGKEWVDKQMPLHSG
jgi:hypothetical protein